MSKGGWRWGLAAAVLWLVGASAEEFSVDTVILSESPNDQSSRSQPIYLEPPSLRTYLIRFDEPALPAQLHRAGWSPGRQPENFTRLDTSSPEARSLIALIDQRQQDHLQTVAAIIAKQPEVRHQHRAALNGAALRLTPEQAERISQLPMVASIQPDTVQKILTDLSPDWLGATQLWNGAAVPSGVASAGEGVIFGIIDPDTPKTERLER